MVIKSAAALAIVWGGTGRPAPDRAGLDREGVTVAFVMNTLTFTGDERDLMATPMLTLLAAFAEFERSLLRERQADGIAIAKAKGVYKGRAKALKPDEAQELSPSCGKCPTEEMRTRSARCGTQTDAMSVGLPVQHRVNTGGE